MARFGRLARIWTFPLRRALGLCLLAMVIVLPLRAFAYEEAPLTWREGGNAGYCTARFVLDDSGVTTQYRYVPDCPVLGHAQVMIRYYPGDTFPAAQCEPSAFRELEYTHRDADYTFAQGGPQTASPFLVNGRTYLTCAYDERDSLKEVRQSPSAWTDPATTPSPLQLTEYQYDHHGNLSRVTRAKGDSGDERVVDYAYDGLNRLKTETQYPGWPTTSPTLVTRFGYDANGNRGTLVDPSGQTTTFGYDALNRLTAIDYSDPATPDVSYGYDADGNRTSMTDGTGSTSYAYDELDRLLSVTSPGPKTVGYRYDRDGNRTRLIYPDGSAVSYSFDRASHLESLLDWASRTTGYQYFPDGALKQVTNFNGTSAAYGYDNARRLKEVHNRKGTATISRHTYTLDRLGNRTRLEEDLAPLGPLAGGLPGGAAVLAGDPATTDEAGAADPGRFLALSWRDPSFELAGWTSPPGEALAQAVGSATPSPSWTPTATRTAVPLGTAVTVQTATPGRTVVPSSTPNATSTVAPTAVPAVTAPATSTTSPPLATGTPTASPSVATSTPTATGSPAVLPPGRPVPDAEELPLLDRTADPSEPFSYRAESDGYLVRLFEKAGGKANVRLEHAASGATLGFELPGTASARLAAGAAASARVGDLTVRWTSYADRLKEDLVLASRPAGDRLVFSLTQTGLSFLADGSGGYFARAPGGATIFQILAPTVEDARGRVGTATLSLAGSTATLSLDQGFLDGATYPVTVDPTVIYVGSSDNATGYNNSPRLLRDQFGKLMIVGRRDSDRALVASWSNDDGQTWTTGASVGAVSDPGATWALGPGGSYLELVCRCAGNLSYGRWTIARDANHNITAITPPASMLQLAAAGDQPSLAIDKHGLPAVAWVHASAAPLWEVRFLRATADPSVRANWKNATGTSTAHDALGSRSVGGVSGSVSLARMPAGGAGGPNDDALYLFWSDGHGDQLRWSRARANGPDYLAWTAPVNKATTLPGRHGVATAPDPHQRGIVFAYRVAADQYRLWRKGNADDSNAADVALLGAAPSTGEQLSFGLDRGDVYAAYLTPTGQVASRRYQAGPGWSAETILDSRAGNAVPTVRQDLSDGRVGLAWTRPAPEPGDQTVFGSFAAARGGATAYEYDRLSRLVGVEAPGGRTAYTYDPLGNRRTMVRGGSTTSYSYDRADRITAAGGVSYAVNANGNLTARGPDSFGYDHAHRLTSASVGGTASTSAYDGDGKRASRTVGGSTTGYIYDVNRGLPVVLEDGARKYVWGPGLAYAVSGSAVEVYHADGLGSVRALTDANGAITQTYQTDEFGAAPQIQGTGTQPFSYTGEQRDAQTGLIYLRARMYDPASGRFLSRDPVDGSEWSPQSLNRHTYVQNNPTTMIDPSGLVTVQVRFIPVAFGHAHGFLVVTDLDGSETYYRAGPSDRLPICAQGLCVPGGVLKAEYGAFIRGTIDWGEGEQPKSAIAAITVWDDDRPAAPKNQILQDFSDEVNRARMLYTTTWTNSNAFVYTALLRLGIQPPNPPATAPGWGNDLFEPLPPATWWS